MLDAVRIPDAANRIGNYPHEFSGGMRQRIMIAMALLCRPRLLIADEPTTALDVTVQAQIMTLLAELQQEYGSAMILITHDLGIVAGSCVETLVMYGGQVMEHGTTEAIFERPTHPYTMGLLKAVPRLDRKDRVLPDHPRRAAQHAARLPAGCPFEPRCPLAARLLGEPARCPKPLEGSRDPRPRLPPQPGGAGMSDTPLLKRRRSPGLVRRRRARRLALDAAAQAARGRAA